MLHALHTLAHDQIDNAARLQSLGVAGWIDPSDYRAAVVAEKLRQLTQSPTVAGNCRGVARRLEGVDPLADTCALIEGMV